MSDIVLKAENIKKTFSNKKEKVKALKGINFSLNKGQMIAIMGPSGSGKSTFLHILGTIDTPTEGKVYINNEDVFSLNEKRLAKLRNKEIGFVFQFHHLLPEFTALENVALAYLIYNKSKKEAFEKAKEILVNLGLKDRLNHKPSELSGGQQQRVAIARAIINKPSIIIADEPTGNLDTKNSKKVMEIFKHLNEKYNVSIVIATHDVNIAKYCQSIYYMEDGLIFSKSP
ncbi:MAG TPA: ABC transporter ATP-binding protein [Persephonella sp.]|nr:ABC transporter ATP-binding protein [Hydrogenothermaceae bacterium]HIQ24885.1 ABC transporter ATP-binding protein [Persephonella sp.]